MFVSQLLLPIVKMLHQIKVESLFPEDVVKSIFDVPLFDVVENDKLMMLMLFIVSKVVIRSC
jgi:hypothetical protein